ncbi:MAG TPA: DUF262 domain-containing protein [Anaeromyxobacteraceae bacterium]|jgi:hypothetical protein|nr:DUF262 domain-containing protein [Anaeromyxobacteraceae bacterium]
MERTTIEKFFAGKQLVIPSFQRDYAWEPANVDDLWSDIREALELAVSHYLGTFILARRHAGGSYDLVDGQQRLTTITMMLQALVDRLPASDTRRRIINEEKYLRGDEGDRLTLLGDNAVFFKQLLANQHPEPRTGGQKRLVRAYAHIKSLVESLACKDAVLVPRWLDGIGKLQVLEFVEEDSGNAIRIFETVNDRGRPLATVDKIKSFLIHTSNRYLGSELDGPLQERFGRIFRSFDAVKDLGGGRLQIELIVRERFTEDAVLRYHFTAYPSQYHDYKFTAEDVLDHFLKPAVKQKVANGQLKELKAFLDDYSEDLAQFFEAFVELLRRGDTEPQLFKIFTSLVLSAYLYPLTIRLAQMKILDTELPGATGRTFLDAIETADVRVYKTRGTTPEKDIAKLARDARALPPAAIASRLREFVSQFMPDATFRFELRGNVYENNEGVRFILNEFDEAYRLRTGSAVPTVGELKQFRAKDPTIDHVLAQQPTFDGDSRGFKDEADYNANLHRLGNLAILERSINSAAQTKSPEQKASEDKLYPASAYVSTQRLAADLGSDAADGKTFGAITVDARTNELIEFCATRWILW